MSARRVIVANIPADGAPGQACSVNGVLLQPHQEVHGHWDGEKWLMGEALTRGPTITLPAGRARNLSRRELRARERSRQIVTRSDVPLTRSEREKREIATYWQMRFDERTAKAQIVVARWAKIRELREKAFSKVSFLGEAVSLLQRLGSSTLVPIAMAEAEAAVEEAESFILHEGADRYLGDATWAPRAELRLQRALVEPPPGADLQNTLAP